MSVSSDFVGTNRAGIVDGLATLAEGDENVVLYVWYDNEFGYSGQVVARARAHGGRAPADPAPA